MKKSLLIAAALTMSISLSGCLQHIAALTGELDSTTARALNVDKSQVTDTSNMEAGAYTTTWDAVVDGKTYHCSATDMFEDAKCRPA